MPTNTSIYLIPTDNCILVNTPVTMSESFSVWRKTLRTSWTTTKECALVGRPRRRRTRTYLSTKILETSTSPHLPYSKNNQMPRSLQVFRSKEMTPMESEEMENNHEKHEIQIEGYLRKGHHYKPVEFYKPLSRNVNDCKQVLVAPPTVCRRSSGVGHLSRPGIRRISMSMSYHLFPHHLVPKLPSPSEVALRSLRLSTNIQRQNYRARLEKRRNRSRKKKEQEREKWARIC